MSGRSGRDTSTIRYRRQQSADIQQKSQRHGRTGSVLSRDVGGLKATTSANGENFPSAVPLVLDVVRGPDGLPANELAPEVLRGKLCILQANSTEVNALFMELSAQLVSISSEERIIYVTFKSFEEIWKFTTYYSMGVLGHCLENLLFDEAFWLSHLKDDVSISVSIPEEELHMFYKNILMDEGSLFASCSANQMFDSSTSGGDLYLEQGDIAQFEPPFLGSSWTVLCLADGARGTSLKPALEPVIPFHQWFLQNCAENILVGDGKPLCHFPLFSAQGICEAIQDYDAEGPAELKLAPGDRIIIVGLLLSCFTWFMGRKEDTGEEGLVKTFLVKPCSDTFESAGLVWEEEELILSKGQEDKIISRSIAALKKISKNKMGRNFKLDAIANDSGEKKESSFPSNKDDNELKENIAIIISQQKDLLPDNSSNSNDSPEVSKQPSEANLSPVCFTVYPVTEGERKMENFAPLFSFLEGQEYKNDFGFLYNRSAKILAEFTFKGHANEEELTTFLSAGREAARNKRLFWCQTRLCFLLGKLCLMKSKFSQARVYFEESLHVPREGFRDSRLLAAIYSNLAVVYLLQKNTESFFAAAEHLVALLLVIPDCIRSFEHQCVLEYILKKAILCHNKKAEAWACHLLMKHHLFQEEDDLVVPFLERLLVLGDDAPSAGFLELGKLYSKLHLPHLSLSAGRRASKQQSASLCDCLNSMLLVLNNGRAQGISSLPQLPPHLHKILSLPAPPGGQGIQSQVLNHQLTLCLCQRFQNHKMYNEAICHMHAFFKNTSPTLYTLVSVLERNSSLIWLAWLHIDNNQPHIALDILDSVLTFMPEHCTTPQEGVVLNMRGVALRCMGNLRRAVENYQAAIEICQEYDDIPNWAVAQANLGLLCIKAGAQGLAEKHLIEAIQLFSELSEKEYEAHFITVLLELGQHYVKLQLLDFSKGCYEWALLLAKRANLLEKQLIATRHLCHLYGCQIPDRNMSIIYSHHQIQLLRCTGNREQEGDAMEAISQLYLAVGTERGNRAALYYTKTSLGIFIDLGCRKREAYGWLQAGKIYHLLGQTELVDIYIQAAQDVALSTGDTNFILKLLEAAGDIFLNSRQDQTKSIIFYRDRALPIAVKNGCVQTRLRLCHKLAEVMLHLQLYGEAMEFAQTAVDISISIGEQLNERVASHRLAIIFHNMEQFELAEHYYLRTLSLCPAPLQFDEETLYYVRVYQTLGDLMFYNVKDPFDAAGYYHLALAAAMDLGNKRYQLKLCTRLATIYHNFLVDREVSLFFYQRARGFAAELNVKRLNI